MGNVIQIDLETVNEKIRFAASARENDTVSIDYFPPYGDGQGYTSLELLLISFASCISSVILTLVRGKMRKTIHSLKAHAQGTVKEQHPKSLSQIELALTVESPDLKEAELEKAIAVSEEKLCPVWDMLKGNVQISVTYAIDRSQDRIKGLAEKASST